MSEEMAAWVPEANPEKWFDFKLVSRRHSLKPETGEEKDAARGGHSLSIAGMKHADDTFTQEFLEEDPVRRHGRKWTIAASGKERADQTAQIYLAVRKYVTGEEPQMIETWPELNEGNIEGFVKKLMNPNDLNDMEWKKWVKMWHDGEGKLPDGMLPMKELAGNFARRFLKELRQSMEKGGAVGFVPFNHGPSMLALLVTIEDVMLENGHYVKIITDPRDNVDRLNRDKLLDQRRGILKVLQTLDVSVTSADRKNALLTIGGNKVTVPLSVFEKIAGEDT